MTGGTDTTQIQNKKPLSEEVRLHLWSSPVFTVYQQVAEKFKLPKKASSQIGAVVFQMMDDKFPFSDFPKQIQEQLGVDESTAKRIAVTVSNGALAKIKNEINNFDAISSAWATELGMEVESVETKDDKVFVKEFLDEMPDKVSPRIEGRLISILLGFMKGQKTAEQVVLLLSKPPKVGGVGIERDSAKMLLDSFSADLKEKGFEIQKPQPEKIKKKLEEKSADKKVEAPKVKNITPTKEKVATAVLIEKQKPKLEEKNEKLDTFSDSDEKEIAKIKQDKKELLETKGIVNIEDVIKRVCDQSLFRLETEELTKRCENIVRSRIRDIRDPFEARRQMESPVEKGGLGVTGRKLADMMGVLEKAAMSYQEGQLARVQQEREQKKKDRIDQRSQQTHSIEKDAQVLSKRYAEITGKSPTESVAPVQPARSRTSVAISQHAEMQQIEDRIDTDRVRQAIEKTKIKNQKHVPKTATGRPKVEDVSYQKMLAGPTEELANLSLVEFRRLAEDPEKAIEKIIDKLDLLEEEGYTQKIAGINAWKASPVNQLYVSLTREALVQAMPIAAVVEERKRAKQDVLEKNEVDAIMQLNASLRF